MIRVLWAFNLIAGVAFVSIYPLWSFGFWVGIFNFVAFTWNVLLHEKGLNLTPGFGRKIDLWIAQRASRKAALAAAKGVDTQEERERSDLQSSNGGK